MNSEFKYEVQIANILSRVTDFFDKNQQHDAVKDPKQGHLRSALLRIFSLARRNSPCLPDIRPEGQEALSEYGARISFFTRAGGILIIRIVPKIEGTDIDTLAGDAYDAVKDYHRYIEVVALQYDGKKSVSVFEALY